MQLLRELITWLVNTVGEMGYTGIVSLMFLESSFFPFPSEVVMIPAGYHVWTGEMSFVLVVMSGIAGSILGALFNYWIAAKWGRPFFIKFGKYFFVSPESLDKADAFFARHGHVSTLVGRLIPVIRQYISLPAGVSRLNLGTFTFYTAVGSGIWVVILTVIGYALGEHQELARQYLPFATLGAILLGGVIVAVYVVRCRRRA